MVLIKLFALIFCVFRLSSFCGSSTASSIEQRRSLSGKNTTFNKKSESDRRKYSSSLSSSSGELNSFDTEEGIDNIDYFKIKPEDGQYVQMTAWSLKDKPTAYPEHYESLEDPVSVNLLDEKENSIEKALSEDGIKALEIKHFETYYTFDKIFAKRNTENITAFIEANGEAFPRDYLYHFFKKKPFFMQKYRKFLEPKGRELFLPIKTPQNEQSLIKMLPGTAFLLDVNSRGFTSGVLLSICPDLTLAELLQAKAIMEMDKNDFSHLIDLLVKKRDKNQEYMKAIENREWDQVEILLETLGKELPEDPEVIIKTYSNDIQSHLKMLLILKYFFSDTEEGQVRSLKHLLNYKVNDATLMVYIGDVIKDQARSQILFKSLQNLGDNQLVKMRLLGAISGLLAIKHEKTSKDYTLPDLKTLDTSLKPYIHQQIRLLKLESTKKRTNTSSNVVKQNRQEAKDEKQDLKKTPPPLPKSPPKNLKGRKFARKNKGPSYYDLEKSKVSRSTTPLPFFEGDSPVIESDLDNSLKEKEEPVTFWEFLESESKTTPEPKRNENFLSFPSKSKPSPPKNPRQKSVAEDLQIKT